MEEAEVMDADADVDAWTSVLKVVATRLSRGLAHCVFAQMPWFSSYYVQSRSKERKA